MGSSLYKLSFSAQGKSLGSFSEHLPTACGCVRGKGENADIPSLCPFSPSGFPVICRIPLLKK